MEFDERLLADRLERIDPRWPSAEICVAVSGGLDSSVLLHSLAALWRDRSMRGLRAVHVDHRLQPDSAAWADACRRSCESLALPLEIVTLALVPTPGESVEAEARAARYAALARLLRPGEWLLTAHHRDDQLETVLIQLLRGAGVAGLAAMPERAPLAAGWHMRPLLAVDRAALAAYAARRGLDWIHDPTNVAPRFDRGWLRSEVLPAILKRWPAAASTVARSASHLAEAQRLLTALAQSDAPGIVDGGRLSIAGLRRLSRDRQVNLVRWWIRERDLPAPSTSRLATGIDELIDARADAAPLLRWPAGEIRRYRDRLYALHPMAPPPQGAMATSGPANVALGPGLGCFGLLAGDRGGLRAEPGTQPVIRFRAGGESLRPHPARPRKRLKDLCQEAGIVPWMRGRLPLVFVGDRLAAVADLWIDADFAVPPGGPALMPVWIDRPELY